MLKEANLSGVTLTDASLKFTDMREANLKGVDLSAADTRDAVMATRLDSLDLDVQEIVKAHALWISTDGVRGHRRRSRAA